ncbi:hypothetical protein HMI56_004310 [Coelomomyces lativittatus]|nr:hypothetical protein HMI56_004310 [Coelomomyces lativittatus]
MRMRTNVVHPKILYKFVYSFERISKKCVLRLTPARIHFVLKDPGEGTQVWCTIPAPSVLEDYLVESNYQNEIWLEIKIEYLLRAFKSMLSGHLVTMKLSKENHIPVLAIAIHSENRDTTLVIQQVVPVQPLRRIQIQELREPRIPAQEVYILLPSLLQLKTLAERYRALSPHATFASNHHGKLILSIDAPNVSIETEFNNLRNPAPYVNNVAALQPQIDPSRFFSVTIDINDFLKFLHWYMRIF